MREAGVEVRTFRDEDEDAVVAVWEACFPGAPPRNDPRRIIERKRGVLPELFLVAESEAELVGAVVGGWDGYRGWVYHLATAPRVRRRGVATALMRELEQRLAALGCPKVNLQVLPDNHEVSAFYRSLGYVAEERLDFGKLLASE